MIQRSDADRVAQEISAAAPFKYGGFLGDGAYKYVYRIEDGGTSKALKVYKGPATERTQGEIDALTRCNHPSIVKYDGAPLRTWTDAGGQSYVFSIEEHLGGGSLEAKLAKGVLARAELLALGTTLVDVIGYLAGLGLVHRDLKPANIMFRATGEPVVVDFGLVRDLAATSKTPTWAPTGPGSPWYASPEQLNNEKDLIDWRTDQFCIAVVLTIAGSGQHPFARTTDPYDTLNRVAQRKPPEAAALQWAAAQALPCIPRMLSGWPVQRYRTPAELQTAWAKQ
jgi:serine/threonine protein kinase